MSQPRAAVGAPMLAIVAPSFNQVSETFVADHARALLPGATVLVCQDGAGAERFGHPVLSDIGPAPALAGGRRDADRAAARLRRRLGFGPVLGFERAAAAGGLPARASGVTVALAEFGYVGVLVDEVCAMARRAALRLLPRPRRDDAQAPAVARPALPPAVPAGRAASSPSRASSPTRSPRSAARRTGSTVIAERDRRGRASRPADAGARPHRRGRPLVEMKAPHLTLAAFAADRRPLPAGPSRPRRRRRADAARCAALVAERGLGDRVTLHGYQSHAACAALMARAAIFVQHSVTDSRGRIEGFPVAIAEAMASALPVVSTRHSGIPEHVRDGVSGYLVAEGDVAGMAEALARLLADPGQAAAMGRAGRAWALEHLSRPARLRAAARARWGCRSAGGRGDAGGRGRVSAAMAGRPQVTLFVLAYRQEAQVGAAVAGAFAQTDAAARDPAVGRREPRRHLR